MIDLHSHILPGLDDGAPDIEVSVAMAQLAVADGITQMACTPHVLPGKYPNTSATILPAIDALQAVLDARAIPLTLLAGADVHVDWDLPEKLAAGDIPTLNGSRYFLLEPPHEILPPRLELLASRLLDAGFVPVITHPERLGWIRKHYEVIQALGAMGCPLQLTADSIAGGFGGMARDYSLRMLDEGIVSLFASDAHSARWRKPLMSAARQIVAEGWGEAVAEDLFLNRPAAIACDAALPPLPRHSGGGSGGSGRTKPAKEQKPGFLRRILGSR